MKQYEIYWVDLNPTVGKEINKVRPCLILSPNEMNKHFGTIVIAPITSTIRNFPTRVGIYFKEREAQVVIDQIRSIDKKRLRGKIGLLYKKDIEKIKDTLNVFLVE